MADKKTLYKALQAALLWLSTISLSLRKQRQTNVQTLRRACKACSKVLFCHHEGKSCTGAKCFPFAFSVTLRGCTQWDQVYFPNCLRPTRICFKARLNAELVFWGLVVLYCVVFHLTLLKVKYCNTGKNWLGCGQECTGAAIFFAAVLGLCKCGIRTAWYQEVYVKV